MEKTVLLAGIELARVDWSKLREIRSSFGERIVSAASPFMCFAALCFVFPALSLGVKPARDGTTLNYPEL
jgi:hypothetical protein